MAAEFRRIQTVSVLGEVFSVFPFFSGSFYLTLYWLSGDSWLCSMWSILVNLFLAFFLFYIWLNPVTQSVLQPKELFCLYFFIVIQDCMLELTSPSSWLTKPLFLFFPFCSQSASPIVAKYSSFKVRSRLITFSEPKLLKFHNTIGKGDKMAVLVERIWPRPRSSSFSVWPDMEISTITSQSACHQSIPCIEMETLLSVLKFRKYN